MNRDALEAAGRYAAAVAVEADVRDLAHFEAGARTASHDDLRAAMRLWRDHPARRGAVRRAWPELGRTLDALVAGWRT